MCEREKQKKIRRGGNMERKRITVSHPETLE